MTCGVLREGISTKGLLSLLYNGCFVCNNPLPWLICNFFLAPSCDEHPAVYFFSLFCFCRHFAPKLPPESYYSVRRWRARNSPFSLQLLCSNSVRRVLRATLFPPLSILLCPFAARETFSFRPLVLDFNETTFFFQFSGCLCD